MSTAAPLKNTAAKSPLVSNSSHAGLLLQRKCSCGKPATSSFSSECGECNKNRLQKKLRIGASNDPLEQEADRVADQVLAAPAHSTVSSAMPSIQRFTGHAAGNLDIAPPIVDHVLSASGSPLDPALQQDMGQRFGHDFSQVRVHTGLAAEQSARDVNAHAYTVGNNIVFGADRFVPGSHEGKRLLAHELTHVVQQSGLDRIRVGQSNENSGLSTNSHVVQQRGDASDSHVLSLNKAQPRADGSIVQRQPAPPKKWKILSQDEIKSDSKREKLRKQSGQTEAKVCRTFGKKLDITNCPSVLEPGKEVNVVEKKLDGLWLQIENTGFAGFGPKERTFVLGAFVDEALSSLESGEHWLDPSSSINKSWALYRQAKVKPTQPNLKLVWASRSEVKNWLTSIGKTLAPQGAKLTRRNLDDYRRFYASAEQLWIASDKLLAQHKYPDAAKGTYTEWAVGSGKDQGDSIHAKNVPTTAKYHVDLFGEGYFKGAINIGMAERTSTTGIHNSRVPNLIYRRFSSKDARLPIADHAADLVTSENGPIRIQGLAEEIARIIAPGGTIVLINPISEESYHDKVAKATGGTVKKVHTTNGVETVQTTIVVPGP
ncbi:eCIS core domain-containing protein [Candidatus Nitrotoga sp. M5]|uniref:eCIS core domain-containing protein n=1 Tax=Candidatus Nitrotoga sp. M5 TaxID=2890409 RepID=UPI001EF73175|nr:DUF4157 domain-containing protein [Candidatus Nitrotoga sp. M5]CAH1388056.1 conserved hypothetical protein [Candidatus Nitrotoga sp. M5]